MIIDILKTVVDNFNPEVIVSAFFYIFAVISSRKSFRDNFECKRLEIENKLKKEKLEKLKIENEMLKEKIQNKELKETLKK